MKNTFKLFKKTAVFGIIAALCIVLFPSCETLSVSGVSEPQQGGENALGFGITGTMLDGISETNLFVFPDANPGIIDDEKNFGFGYDSNLKINLDLIENRLIFSPLFGFGIRYLPGQYDSDSMWEEDSTLNDFGIGLNIGVGMAINITPQFFLDAKAMYLPSFLSLNMEPGFRFNVGIGYRFESDPWRRGLSASAGSNTSSSSTSGTSRAAPSNSSQNNRTGDIPSKIDIPTWMRMGMSVEEVRANVPNKQLVPVSALLEGDHENKYAYTIGNETYVVTIIPGKGLVSLQIGFEYNVRSAVQVLKQHYGEPILETSTIIMWMDLENSKNIDSINITLERSTFLNMIYYFENFFDDQSSSSSSESASKKSGKSSTEESPNIAAGGYRITRLTRGNENLTNTVSICVSIINSDTGIIGFIIIKEGGVSVDDASFIIMLENYDVNRDAFTTVDFNGNELENCVGRVTASENNLTLELLSGNYSLFKMDADYIGNIPF